MVTVRGHRSRLVDTRTGRVLGPRPPSASCRPGGRPRTPGRPGKPSIGIMTIDRTHVNTGRNIATPSHLCDTESVGLIRTPQGGILVDDPIRHPSGRQGWSLALPSTRRRLRRPGLPSHRRDGSRAGGAGPVGTPQALLRRRARPVIIAEAPGERSEPRGLPAALCSLERNATPDGSKALPRRPSGARHMGAESGASPAVIRENWYWGERSDPRFHSTPYEPSLNANR